MAWILLKVQTSGNDVISFWSANFAVAQAAVQNGQIAGMVEDKTLIPHVIFQGDAKTLQTFVSEHSDQLFTDAIGDFQRVR